VAVWRNNGDGTFAERVEFAAGSIPLGMVLADFDNDGFVDVVTANKGNNTASLLRHNGQTGAAAALLPPVHSNAVANTSRVAAADVNGDGRIDLAVGGFDNLPPPGGGLTYPTGINGILINNGNGTFTKTAEYLPTPPPNRAGSPLVAFADLDNDGDFDLIGAGAPESTGSIDYGVIAVRRNNAQGIFGPVEHHRFQNFVWIPQNLVITDLNADGWRDIVASTPSGRANDGFAVLMNNAAGSFHLPADFYHASQQTYGVVAADADNDGDRDVITVAIFCRHHRA
jgi:hypothetical protein